VIEMEQVAAPMPRREHDQRDEATTRPVMACVSHGPAADATTRVAASLARLLGTELVTATVRQPSPALSRGARRRADHADGHERLVALGEPAEQLAILADRHAARLLVVAAPDPSAPTVPPLGAVYMALAGAGACPVVVVPPGVRSLARSGPIVCGVDGSGRSLTAARVIARLADSIGASLRLVKAIEPLEGPRHDFDAIRMMRCIATSRRLRRSTTASGRPPKTRLLVEEGAAADVLAATVERESALLLGVGSRGRRGSTGPLLGSVASTLALRARTPVLIVPSRAVADPSRTAPTPGRPLAPDGRT
jgi:nucleotide-binding universal stress UspA family protein